MANLKLGGKEYELKFTYKAILALEGHYGMGIGKIFKELDLENIGVLNTFVYACLKRHEDLKHITAETVADMLDEAFESGDLTFEDLATAVQEAVEKSILIKQAQVGNGKKGKTK